MWMVQMMTVISLDERDRQLERKWNPSRQSVGYVSTEPIECCSTSNRLQPRCVCLCVTADRPQQRLQPWSVLGTVVSLLDLLVVTADRPQQRLQPWSVPCTVVSLLDLSDVERL